MHRRIAVVLAVAALAACLACPQPSTGGASGASAPPPAASSATVPTQQGTVNSETGGAHGSAALTISGTTWERVSSGGASLGSRLTLRSSQTVPTGNDGTHDIVRSVDAFPAAALAVDSDPSLVWLADSDKRLDMLQLKVSLAVAVTADTIIDNPLIVEHSALSGGQSKVCVTGFIGGVATTDPVCLTLTTVKADQLARWLQQVRVATAITSGLDPHRARLHIGDPSAQSVAELTFALKP